MKKKRMVLVMAVSAMCMMAGCGNTVKDGTEALEQGDYDTAIASFEEAAGSDDKEEAAEGYCGLGMTYYEQKQYDQALEMLEKAFDNGTVKTADSYKCKDIPPCIRFLQNLRKHSGLPAQSHFFLSVTELLFHILLPLNMLLKSPNLMHCIL